MKMDDYDPDELGMMQEIAERLGKLEAIDQRLTRLEESNESNKEFENVVLSIASEVGKLKDSTDQVDFKMKDFHGKIAECNAKHEILSKEVEQQKLEAVSARDKAGKLVRRLTKEAFRDEAEAFSKQSKDVQVKGKISEFESAQKKTSSRVSASVGGARKCKGKLLQPIEKAAAPITKSDVDQIIAREISNLKLELQGQFRSELQEQMGRYRSEDVGRCRCGSAMPGPRPGSLGAEARTRHEVEVAALQLQVQDLAAQLETWSQGQAAASGVVETGGSAGQTVDGDGADALPSNAGIDIDDIPDFSGSGSTSKPGFYESLLAVVKDHPYIAKQCASAKFTLEVQSQLICRVRRMQTDDLSVLYQLARSYYDNFRTSDAAVFVLLERFCADHPEVISGKKYGTELRWTLQMNCDLGFLLNAIEDQQLRARDVYLRAKQFLKTVPWNLPFR